MLKKNIQGYYHLPELTKYPHLFHAISGRHFGNLGYGDKFESNANIKKFLKTLGKKETDLVLADQPHGNRLKIVSRAESGKVVSGVDGLVTREKDLLVGVKTSDCLPLLFFDPEEKNVAVVHAGWRGVYKQIPAKTVDLFIKLGSLPQNIQVGIGPAIGGCCYNVGDQRAKDFLTRFGNIPGMLRKTGSQNYLDILYPALSLLSHSGVKPRHIFLSETCTSCQSDRFFSQRGDRPEDHGSMLAVICLT